MADSPAAHARDAEDRADTDARDSARDAAATWLDRFDQATARGDIDGVAALFAAESYWRDLVAFTWNIVTVENPSGIADMLTACLARTNPREFRLTSEPEVRDGHVEFFLAFTTDAGTGSGHVRLADGRNAGDAGKAWTILTTLQELHGFPEPAGPRRPRGVEHRLARGRRSWAEEREIEAATLGMTEQPYVLVIGGGQGGIALGARLRQLGVPALVVDRHERPGDQWRQRYNGLCLHDPVWYDHMPYIPFPDNWPVFTPKDKMGDWLEMYTRVMEIPYWGNSPVTSAEYQQDSGQWLVTIDRDGETVQLRPRHIVFATGALGSPNRPSFRGMDEFAGEQYHSSEYRDPERHAGKNVVVVGSNNSAHDICGLLWEHGARVTMVQRSSTHVSRSETLMDLAFTELYSEEAAARGISTDEADMRTASIPYRIMHTYHIPLAREMARRDKDFYDRLAAAGFRHDWGDDGSGLMMKSVRRGSGYYIDVGASELICNGEVALAHGQVDHLTADAVVLDDGTELPADVVVYATGYGSMNEWVARIVDDETADKVGKVWGLGSDTTKDPGPWEGELRNMWKPTQQEALWFHGGNLALSRYYSLFLALQLKARYEQIPTPVYGLQPVHHTR